MTTNLSQNQIDTLAALAADRPVPASRAKTLAGLAALGLVVAESGRFLLTNQGGASLKCHRDAANARARAATAARRAARELAAARAEKRLGMTPEQIEAAFDEYRRARPGQNIGSLEIDADGKAYEAVSWERLMSE